MGRVATDVTRSGPPTVLTPAEETRLAEFVVQCAKIGYPLGKEEVILWAQKVLEVDGRKTPFKNNLPGDPLIYKSIFTNNY